MSPRIVSRADQPSFLTGTKAPKSERLHLPMRPVDEITDIGTGA
jgi:hypothetical protein